jgi:ribonucleoside-diphosphate reductase alpha chain
MAWFSGLKTTYYLRSLAATGTEKSTVNTGQLNAVSQQSETTIQPAPVPQACSLDDPDCEACQ